MSFGQDTQLSMQDFSGAEYIGDIEQNKILYKKINGLDFYAISENESPISFIQVQTRNILGKDYLEIRNIFTKEEYRGQNYAKKLLFFLKNVEKKSFVFGDIQSKLGQLLVRSVSKSNRFPMFWLNIKTGDKQEYEPEKDNPNLKPYRSFFQQTDWVVIAESLRGESFTSRFLTENDPNCWHKYIQWFD